jgi:NAD+ synthase
MNKYPKNQSELSDMAWSYRVGLVKMARETGMLPKLIDDVADYFDYHGIQDVVLGVSGGIDSALALAVLVEVQKRQHLNIHAEVITFDAFAHVFDKRFVNILYHEYNSVQWNMYDLSDAFIAMGQIMNRGRTGRLCGFEEGPEANITYAMRYQALFARAQQVGGITIGTTNRDELEYAGWFGKNSDMVTDVQFLWRFPKCVIREFARALGVPDEIITRTPVGDLIDGSSDEQNFGCTYDELRWYTDVGRHHVTHTGPHTEYMLRKFDRLEAPRKKNMHKYAAKAMTHYNPVFL